MRKSSASLYALLLLPLVGCAHLQGLMPQEKPKLTFKTMHLRDIDFKQATLDFEFELANPYGVGIALETLEYKLEIDGKPFLQGKSAKPLNVAAKATSPITLPYTVEFLKVAQVLAEFFSKRDELPYTLQVAFGIKTPVGVVTLPGRTSGTFPLPKLPAVSMGGVKLGKMGFTGAELVFELKVANKSSFPLRLKGGDYGVEIGGVSVASGRVEIPTLPGNQEATVRIPIQLQFLKLGMAVVNAIKSKQLPYRFSGALDLGLFKRNFTLSGQARL